MSRGFRARESSSEGPLRSQVNAAEAEAARAAESRQRDKDAANKSFRLPELDPYESKEREKSWQAQARVTREQDAEGFAEARKALGVANNDLRDMEQTIARALTDEDWSEDELEEVPLGEELWGALQKANLDGYDTNLEDKVNRILAERYNDNRGGAASGYSWGTGKGALYGGDTVGVIKAGEIELQGKKYTVALDWIVDSFDYDGKPEIDWSVRLRPAR